MHKKKYAVFTMDVEAFTDTDCLSDMSDEVNVDLLDGFEEYIKLLDKHGIKSTLFTVGNLIPRLTERLRPHLANGHRLALHNYDHIAPMKIRPEEFKSRLKKSKKQLQEELNTEVVGFRAPCFSLDKERLDILHELGFRYDSSHLGYLKANHTVELDLGDFEECRRGIFRRKGFYEFEISKQNFFGKPFPISGGRLCAALPLGHYTHPHLAIYPPQ